MSANKIIQLLARHPWRFVGGFFALNVLVGLVAVHLGSISDFVIIETVLSVRFFARALAYLLLLTLGVVLWRLSKIKSNCKWPSRLILGLWGISVIAWLCISLVTHYYQRAYQVDYAKERHASRSEEDKREFISYLKQRIQEPNISETKKQYAADLYFQVTGESKLSYQMPNGSEVRYAPSKKFLENERIKEELRKIKEIGYFSFGWYVVQLVVAVCLARLVPLYNLPDNATTPI